VAISSSSRIFRKFWV
jgi:hypothetical protein